MPPLRNSWAAYQFDAAVLHLGLAVENALHEREEYGPSNARQSRPRYTLTQLLEPAFRLHPAPPQGLAAMAAAMPGTVSRWKQRAKAA